MKNNEDKTLAVIIWVLICILVGISQVTLCILKACGILACSWVLVFLPLIITVGIPIMLGFGALIMYWFY